MIIAPSSGSKSDSIQNVIDAVAAIKAGGMVIMTDDEDRENEGDLVFAADEVCADKINFMTKHGRGIICLTLNESETNRLKLPLMNMTGRRGPSMNTAFTVTIEAKTGVTTGISAADRAHTIRVAIAEGTTAEDLVVPGHIFPIRARPGGVLERVGHTEGSVDLARLAGHKPAGVICEIMNDDGSMARRDDLLKFSRKFEIPMVSIADLVTYRLLHDTLVTEVADRPFVTDFGTFRGKWFSTTLDEAVHFALVKGEDFTDKIVDVRVQRQNPIYDVFSQANSSSLGEQREWPSRATILYSLNMLKTSSAAAVVYLGHGSKQNADNTLTDMDPRVYGIGAQILKKLGIASMRVHVTSERSLVALRGFDLDVVEMKLIRQPSRYQS